MVWIDPTDQALLIDDVSGAGALRGHNVLIHVLKRDRVTVQPGDQPLGAPHPDQRVQTGISPHSHRARWIELRPGTALIGHAGGRVGDQCPVIRSQAGKRGANPPSDRPGSPFVEERPLRLSRRAILALGAASLLGGCADEPATAVWHSNGELPGDSQNGGQPPSDGPSTDPSWQIPPADRPTPGICPTVQGVVSHPGGPRFYLPCSGANIALTIDDGPDPQYTPQILTLLAKYKIHATFCMIGKKVAANPAVVAAVLDGRHIANHTFSHPLNLITFPQPKVRAEIARANDAIAAAGGGRPTLYRAPGGAWSPAVLSECAAQQVRPLDWSVDPRDWSEPGVQHIVTTILTKTHPGSIILEHDGGGNREQTVSALTIALPRLIDAGYRFTQP